MIPESIINKDKQLLEVVYSFNDKASTTLFRASKEKKQQAKIKKLKSERFQLNDDYLI